MLILFIDSPFLTFGDIVMKKWLLRQDWTLCKGGMAI
jgi:hypothetical protein